LQKLLYLKQREEMKDALIHQVKQKYFEKHPDAKEKMRGKSKALDSIIGEQVSDFQAQNAKLSADNLNRLLQRVDNETKQEEDKKSHLSEYSHLSQLSHASQAESVRAHVERLAAARGEEVPAENLAEGGGEAGAPVDRRTTSIEDLMGFNWVRLDDYQDRLARDEEEAKKAKVDETREKYTAFLDGQVKLRSDVKEREKFQESLWKYVIEEDNERVKHEDEVKLAHTKALAEREKRERDEAAALKQARIDAEKEEVRQEDIRLLAKVQREIEEALRKEEIAKAEKKAVFVKVKKDIDAAKKLKEEEAARQKAEEMRRAKAYTKLLLEQEEEKKRELERRNARQKELMEKMKSTVAKAAASKGAEDERRANAQRQEKEDLALENEQNKVAKLKKMREETRDYVLMQMAIKHGRRQEHAEVKDAQGGILLEDAEAFYADKQKEKDIKVAKGLAYVTELREQIKERASRKVANMTKEEVKLNKSLIDKVLEDELARGILKKG